jgi:hypothetical protein
MQIDRSNVIYRRILNFVIRQQTTRPIFTPTACRKNVIAALYVKRHVTINIVQK